MGWKTRWTILSSVIRKSICTRVPLVNLNHAFIISCCHLRFKVGLWVIEFCLYTRFFEGLRFMCQLVSTCWLRSRCPAVWNCLFTGSATIQRYQASAKCNRMWKRKRETGKDYRQILFETEICIYIYISARGCLWIMVCSPHTWNIHYIYISPHVGIYVDVDLICDPTLLRTWPSTSDGLIILFPDFLCTRRLLFLNYSSSFAFIHLYSHYFWFNCFNMIYHVMTHGLSFVQQSLVPGPTDCHSSCIYFVSFEKNLLSATPHRPIPTQRNGIIVDKSRRWPLCIDPQGQARLHLLGHPEFVYIFIVPLVITTWNHKFAKLQCKIYTYRWFLGNKFQFPNKRNWSWFLLNADVRVASSLL